MPMEQTDSAQSGALLSHLEVVSDLIRVLTELNQSDIPSRLREIGVTGERHNAQRCPVSNYVKRECAWADTVIVAPGFVSAYPSADCYLDPDLPTAIDNRNLGNISQFIYLFDKGCYPELLTKN